MNETNTENQTSFLPGDRVTNKKGVTGRIKGFEDRNGTDYVVIDMGDFTSKFPSLTFSESFTRISENVPGKKQRNVDLRIKDYIERNRESHAGIYSSPEIAEDDSMKRINGIGKDILDDVISSDLLFRGDSRAPDGKNGIFEDGMHPHGGYANQKGKAAIYASTFLDVSLGYPDEDWDRTFIYIIDPFGAKSIGSVISEESDPEDDVKGHVTLLDIPGDSIKYSLEFNGEGLVKIHSNPRYAY